MSCNSKIPHLCIKQHTAIDENLTITSTSDNQPLDMRDRQIRVGLVETARNKTSNWYELRVVTRDAQNGEFIIKLDGDKKPTGVYFLELELDGNDISRRLVDRIAIVKIEASFIGDFE